MRHIKQIRLSMTLRSVTAVILAMVLALRVVAAPFIMASADPNLMAICAGGQIVYVSIQDGQPVDGGEGPEPEACPFFGIMSVLAGSDAPMVEPVALTVQDVQPALALTLPPDALPYDHRSRAPPLLT